MSHRKKPFVVAIEGNIGSGKSTMIDYFKQFPDVQVHPEPLDKWQNVQGENLLADLYGDPKRWSFLFQSYVQLTRLQIIEGDVAPGKSVKLVERSVQNNRFCFLEMGKSKGNLSELEFHVLEQWFGWMESQMELSLDLIVYLRSTPEIAYHRMMRRGRAEEKCGAPLSYLQSLHDFYENWLVLKTAGDEKLPPILVIDADKDLAKMTETYKKYQGIIRGRRPYSHPDSKENDHDK